MTKIYVLDTNVLITDATAFLAYKKDDIVVIPYKVIEELEKHKLDSGDIGMAVKKVSRMLLSVIGDKKEASLQNGIVLENGSILKVLSSREFKHNEKIGPLKSGDDYILAVAVGLLGQDPDNQVIMVSNDMLLKIRSSSFGIPCIGHLTSAGQVNSLDDLYSGYKTIQVDEDAMNVFWEEAGDKEEASSDLLKKLGLEENNSPNPNEFVILTDSAKNKKRPWSILRRHAGKHKLRFVKEHKFEKIKALNKEQFMAFDLLMDPKVHLVSLMGQAGTGKTLLALEAGLEQVLNKKSYKTVLIIRPVHPVGKDIGFLPGTVEEKLEPWLAPIKDNLRFLLGDSSRDPKQTQKKMDYYFDKGIIEMQAMVHLRGRSINDAFIIIDEAQNCNQHEIKTILTRVGKGTKVVLTGDIEQTDRQDVGALTNGLSVCIEKFKKQDIVGHVTLVEGVRSELSELAAKML